MKANNVDLAKTPLSLGPMLEFDNDTEKFTNHDGANELLARDYRDDFVVPSGDQV